MAERIWDKFLTERDKEVFKLAGYGARAGFGKRPALLIVDVNYAFCGDKREPLLESVKRWRQSGGEAAWDALPVLQKLIGTARDREDAGDLHDRSSTLRQLGCRRLGLEERTQRRKARR